MREKRFDLRRRVDFLWLIISAAAGVLFLRLFQLQILDSVQLGEAAERNRTQLIYQTAPRGSLYDKNGVLLATNEPTFSLIYLPSKKGVADLRPLAQELSTQIHGEPSKILDSLEEAVDENTAIRLAENLPPKTMFRLSELKTLYPGVDLVVEARRYYPLGHFASHLIGYIGRMDPGSWKKLRPKGYRIDSRIGRMGLEKVFEDDLRGRDGGVRMEVDAQGRLKRILERMPWQAGSNVYLTLDAAMQKAADQGLRDSITKRGAVVALDPRDGSILAMASAPDFDPNDLLSSEAPEGQANTAVLPEFNRAISGTYPPGSSFKLVVGAAGLNEGRFTTNDTAFCPGYFDLNGKIFLCWNHKGHKRVSWWMGLAKSCDVYFYTMGLRTGGNLIEKYAQEFGLGALTHVALPGEKSGHLFGPETRASSGRSWYDGDTVNLSIGQGELLVTPIQMAVLVSAVANRGTLWRPHYTERMEYADGRASYNQKPEVLGKIVLKSEVWDDLQEAMRLVVSSGSGVTAAIPGLDVRGKTGTAQNPGGRDHSWFVAYASRPGEAPSVALAVLVENGGFGDVSAIPIARKILLAAFGMEKKSHQAVPKEDDEEGEETPFRKRIGEPATLPPARTL